MTKKDMATTIADATGIPQVQVAARVQRVFDGITQTLLSEGRIELRNFGVFEVKERRPRRARNPRTGEAVDVPARRVTITPDSGRRLITTASSRFSNPASCAMPACEGASITCCGVPSAAMEPFCRTRTRSPRANTSR